MFIDNLANPTQPNRSRETSVRLVPIATEGKIGFIGFDSRSQTPLNATFDREYTHTKDRQVPGLDV
jgi:hypothetical protein